MADAVAAADLRSARAQARHVHMSPMKVRRVVDLIRGMQAEQALSTLQFAPQAASEPVYKVLASAMANIEHNVGVTDRGSLFVSEAYVDEGPTAKRFRPRAQGRAYRINKRTSHITVVIESRPSAATARTSTAKTATSTTQSKRRAR